MLATAIVYDFDGTLAQGNIQEHGFLPDAGISKDKFWGDVRQEAKDTDSDEILVYMRRMLEAWRSVGKPVSRSALREAGASVPFFEGVVGWFDRINAHAKGIGLGLHHYVVSSGNQEIIEGCKIADKFTRIFASKFIFDDNDLAIWPGLAINYTCLFSIFIRDVRWPDRG
jgi:hypothetical protein